MWLYSDWRKIEVSEAILEETARDNIAELQRMDGPQEISAGSRQKLFNLFGQKMKEASDWLGTEIEGVLSEHDVQRLRELRASGVPLHIAMGIIGDENKRARGLNMDTKEL